MSIMAENTILAAGKDGGAVAMVQNHLVRYLISARGAFRAQLVLKDERRGEDMLDKWDALWSEGKLPKGAGQPKDYAYRVQPVGKHKDKPPLAFAFREISGPDLDAYLAEDGELTPALSKELAALLGDSKLNFVLVLLCERDEKAGEDADAPDQDALLSSFVACLKNNYGEEFASRCPVLLLFLKGEDGEGGQGLEAFAGDNLPATLDALQDWQGRYTLGELDMGDLETAEDGEPLLDSPKFEDAGRIFRWIYFQFTRIPVVEPFLTRLWKGVIKSPF